MTAPTEAQRAIQTLDLPGWLPFNSANARMHWATRYRANAAVKDYVLVHAIHAGWKRRDGRVRLTVTFRQPTGPLMDTDNAYARAKAIVDGLKGRYFHDDSPTWLDMDVRVERGPKATVLILSTSSCNEGNT